MNLRKHLTIEPRKLLSYGVCLAFALWQSNRLDGSEFSGGWVTGPLHLMVEIGAGLFFLALPLSLKFPRVAAAFALVAAALSLPIFLFFFFPFLFVQIFAGEWHSRPTPGLHWDPTILAALLTLLGTAAECVQTLFVPVKPRLANVNNVVLD